MNSNLKPSPADIRYTQRRPFEPERNPLRVPVQSLGHDPKLIDGGYIAFSGSSLPQRSMKDNGNWRRENDRYRGDPARFPCLNLFRHAPHWPQEHTGRPEPGVRVFLFA